MWLKVRARSPVRIDYFRPPRRLAAGSKRVDRRTSSAPIPSGRDGSYFHDCEADIAARTADAHQKFSTAIGNALAKAAFTHPPARGSKGIINGAQGPGLLFC